RLISNRQFVIVSQQSSDEKRREWGAGGNSMKRTERRHLKENELQTFAREARDRFEERKRETTWIAALLVVVGLMVGGYFVWHDRVETRAHALLAEALVVQGARIGTPAAPGTPGAGSLSFMTERER